MLGYMGNVFFCGIYGKRFFLWDIWETDFFVGYMGNEFFCAIYGKRIFLWDIWETDFFVVILANILSSFH